MGFVIGLIIVGGIIWGIMDEVKCRCSRRAYLITQAILLVLLIFIGSMMHC